MQLFKNLSEAEKVEYRAWARENYTPLQPIKGIWHPVVQEECAKMNAEKGENLTVEELIG